MICRFDHRAHQLSLGRAIGKTPGSILQSSGPEQSAPDTAEKMDLQDMQQGFAWPKAVFVLPLN